MPAILCVVPHPDDEAFGPAGTIARYAAQGVPVDLLTFTRGQCGTRSTAADTPEALGLLREYETRASARVLGIRDVTILDYMDGDLDQANVEELAGHVLRTIDSGGIDTSSAWDRSASRATPTTSLPTAQPCARPNDRRKSYGCST